MTIKAKCPTCSKLTAIDKSNTWRPFCCERCRLIDLGAWMDGTNSIAGSESEPDFFEEIDMDTPTRH
jgi:endogenous inhibitor of DNA gyrase (YacG/DUF329 family)